MARYNQKQVQEVFIIIPVFNEDPSVLRRVIGDLNELGHTIVVVDDGSTNANLRYLFADSQVKLLRHPVNLGQGAALQTGIDYAKRFHPDVVITFDADGQHHSEDLQTLMLPVLNNEADVVLGSRFLSPDNSKMPFRKKLVLKLARYVNFVFTGILLSDAHNGLRAFSSKAIKAIRISENKMAHASEILFEIKKHRLRFIEVPVKVSYTSYSKQKGQSVLDSVKVLFDLVLHKLFK